MSPRLRRTIRSAQSVAATPISASPIGFIKGDVFLQLITGSHIVLGEASGCRLQGMTLPKSRPIHGRGAFYRQRSKRSVPLHTSCFASLLQINIQLMVYHCISL